MSMHGLGYRQSQKAFYYWKQIPNRCGNWMGLGVFKRFIPAFIRMDCIVWNWNERSGADFLRVRFGYCSLKRGTLLLDDRRLKWQRLAISLESIRPLSHEQTIGPSTSWHSTHCYGILDHRLFRIIIFKANILISFVSFVSFVFVDLKDLMLWCWATSSSFWHCSAYENLSRSVLSRTASACVYGTVWVVNSLDFNLSSSAYSLFESDCMRRPQQIQL